MKKIITTLLMLFAITSSSYASEKELNNSEYIDLLSNNIYELNKLDYTYDFSFKEIFIDGLRDGYLEPRIKGCKDAMYGFSDIYDKINNVSLKDKNMDLHNKDLVKILKDAVYYCNGSIEYATMLNQSSKSDLFKICNLFTGETNFRTLNKKIDEANDILSDIDNYMTKNTKPSS